MQYHMHQSREGEEGSLGSDADISSHKGNRFTASIAFTFGLCGRNTNSSWLRAERLAEEKDLARFFPS